MGEVAGGELGEGHGRGCRLWCPKMKAGWQCEVWSLQALEAKVSQKWIASLWNLSLSAVEWEARVVWDGLHREVCDCVFDDLGWLLMKSDMNAQSSRMKRARGSSGRHRNELQGRAGRRRQRPLPAEIDAWASPMCQLCERSAFCGLEDLSGRVTYERLACLLVVKQARRASRRWRRKLAVIEWRENRSAPAMRRGRGVLDRQPEQ